MFDILPDMRFGWLSLPTLAAVALVASGCGGSTSAGSTPPVSPTTSLTAVPPPTAATTFDHQATGSWVAATTNLSGLASRCGNMSLLSATPDSDTLIAGVALQGLWTSQHGSLTWTWLGQGAGSAVITNRPSSITYDPAHPNTFWESGIYNSGGLYETTNDGLTFRQLGNLTHTDFVSVDLSDPARLTLLSGRHEASQLYRSSDGGATWVDLSSRLPSGVGFTTAPFVVNARTYLLGTKGAPASGIFRTTDSGATWSRVFPEGVAGPAIIGSDGAMYWLLDGGRGLIRSTDHGLTWRLVSVPNPFSFTSSSLIELPNGWMASTNTDSVIVSANHGVTWETIQPAMPYTPTGIIYSPGRNAFYAWRFDCTFTGDSSVKPDAIMRLNFDLPAK